MLRLILPFIAIVAFTPSAGWADFRILALGDSNTWGSNASGPRHGADARWGAVLDAALPNAVVVEEGRVGRRTDLGRGRVFDNIGQDVVTPLPDLIGQHLPLDLAVIMLGTNDLQTGRGFSAEEVAQSAFSLARIALAGGVEQVLVVSPPPLTDPEKGGLGYIFGDSEALSEALAGAYAALSDQTGIPVFDAGQITRADGADGVHLTGGAQRKLGNSLAPVVSQLLSDERS